MATKKSAKDKALDEIKEMDQGSAETKEKAKSTKPKATKPPAEDAKEKEKITDHIDVDAGRITSEEIPADVDNAIKAGLDRIRDAVDDKGFDPDDEDAPEPPETEKMKIITTKNIPADQRFNRVSPVVKATKTQMITTKNMKEFLSK